MKRKWFVTAALVVLVVGFVVGCSEEKKPTAPKVTQRETEEIPFDDGDVKGKMYGGSHDYGRVRLRDLASRPPAASVLSKLNNAGYETRWDRSILIEGRANDVSVSVGHVLLRSSTSNDQWVALTIVDSGRVVALGSAVYWTSPPPVSVSARALGAGIWTTPIETVLGPDAARWSQQQWEDYYGCLAGVVSASVVKCAIQCAMSGPGWFICTTTCSGLAAAGATVGCAAAITVKGMLGGYNKDPKKG